MKQSSKYFPVYNFLNSDGEIIGTLINEGLNPKTKSKVVSAMTEAGFDLCNELSSDAGELWKKRSRKRENLPLFDGKFQVGDIVKLKKEESLENFSETEVRIESVNKEEENFTVWNKEEDATIEVNPGQINYMVLKHDESNDSY